MLVALYTCGQFYLELEYFYREIGPLISAEASISAQ